MRKVGLVAVACALLAMTACGINSPSEAAQAPDQTSTPPAPAAERSTLSMDEGTRRSLGDGVTIMVSAPTSFTPTDTAYPKAGRAIAFQLVLENDGAVVYRPARLSFTATVDGAPANQVIDSTQGYPGVAGAIDDIAPGKELRFAVAFGVPTRPVAIRVEVLPDASTQSAVPVFDGTV